MIGKCKPKLRQNIFLFYILSLERQITGNQETDVSGHCRISREAVNEKKKEDIMAILEVNNVKKVYTTRFGGNQVQALTNVTFSVEKGEYVAIMGESGSGACVKIRLS